MRSLSEGLALEKYTHTPRCRSKRFALDTLWAVVGSDESHRLYQALYSTKHSELCLFILDMLTSFLPCHNVWLSVFVIHMVWQRTLNMTSRLPSKIVLWLQSRLGKCRPVPGCTQWWSGLMKGGIAGRNTPPSVGMTVSSIYHTLYTPDFSLTPWDSVPPLNVPLACFQQDHI